MKKHIFFTIVMLCCLISGLAGPMGKAWAYRFGEVEVKLRGGVSETYDDNVNYSRVNKKSDFITQPHIGFVADYEGKTATVTATGNIYQDFYAKDNNLNRNWQDLSINGQAEISKFDRITAVESFSHTYEPRDFEDEFGRTRGRYSSYRNRVNLGYSRDLSERIRAALRYANEYNDYSIETIPSSFMNTAGVEGSYIVSSDLSFAGAYDFLIRDFDPGSSAKTNTLSGSLRKYLTKQLYFDGRAGVDFIDSYSGANLTRPMFAVSLTDDINDRTRATLSFNRSDSTVSYSQDLFNQWRVSTGLSHRLSQKLRGNISAFYGRGEYTVSGVINKLIGSSAGLTYDINDNWKATANYSYRHETSTATLGGYLKNRVTLGLTAEF